MCKKRLRTRAPAGSKQEVAYWRKRVFKGHYTYQGRRCQVRNWSVKIQHMGRRQTFSLRSSRRIQAAAEARELYRVLVTQGWENAARPSGPTRPEVNFWSGDQG